jgi:hypothetical protein
MTEGAILSYNFFSVAKEKEKMGKSRTRFTALEVCGAGKQASAYSSCFTCRRIAHGCAHGCRVYRVRQTYEHTYPALVGVGRLVIDRDVALGTHRHGLQQPLSALIKAAKTVDTKRTQCHTRATHTRNAHAHNAHAHTQRTHAQRSSATGTGARAATGLRT